LDGSSGGKIGCSTMSVEVEILHTWAEAASHYLRNSACIFVFALAVPATWFADLVTDTLDNFGVHKSTSHTTGCIYLTVGGSLELCLFIYIWWTTYFAIPALGPDGSLAAYLRIEIHLHYPVFSICGACVALLAGLIVCSLLALHMITFSLLVIFLRTRVLGCIIALAAIREWHMLDPTTPYVTARAVDREYEQPRV